VQPVTECVPHCIVPAAVGEKPLQVMHDLITKGRGLQFYTARRYNPVQAIRQLVAVQLEQGGQQLTGRQIPGASKYNQID